MNRTSIAAFFALAHHNTGAVFDLENSRLFLDE